MAREIARRLIDGVWRTVVADESSNGGSQPKFQYLSISATPDGNASAGFAWTDYGADGADALLDLTDPESPVVLADGNYTLYATSAANAADDGKMCLFDVEIDVLGNDGAMKQGGTLDAFTVGQCQVTVGSPLVAGAAVFAQIFNGSTTSKTYTGLVIVVKS